MIYVVLFCPFNLFLTLTSIRNLQVHFALKQYFLQLMSKVFFLEAKCYTYQVGYRVSKLCVELIDETLDQPIAVDRIIYDLLHGSTDGEEVLVLFTLKNKNKTTTRHYQTPKNKGSKVSGIYHSIHRTHLRKLPLLQISQRKYLKHEL